MSAPVAETASLMLIRRPRDPEVFWVRRAPTDRFLSGFSAFPGGRVDPGDGPGPERAARIAALRETAEETGWLPGGRLDPVERAALRAGDVRLEDLRPVDALLPKLVPAGSWRAPPYLVARFRTRFFALRVGPDADPRVDDGDPELHAGGWIRPRDALAAWDRGEVLLAPPTRWLLRALADGALDAPARFTAPAEAREEAHPEDSPIRPHLTLFPLRTPTLPPATHTNCYIVGRDELLIVEPAAEDPAERARLDRWLDARIAAGATVRGIALTHHHHDHVGGVAHLARRLGVPVMAHRLTAERIDHPVDVLLDEGDAIALEGGPTLDVLHTPGHAVGHLCFVTRDTRDAIVGDMVAGVGSILVEPGEGDMAAYLQSLGRLRDLEPASLLPSHGPAIGGARAKLDEYIAHRLDRERQVLMALAAGPADLATLVDRVYVDVPPLMKVGPDGGLAGLSLRAHLDKLHAEGRARRRDAVWSA